MHIKIKKGENRLVLVAGGVAVKFPIIHLYQVVSYLIHLLGKRHPSLILGYCTRGIEKSHTLRRHLFKGIVDNWCEFRFYRQHHFDLLIPTYLSLLGLLSVQGVGKECGMEYDDLWCQLHELTEGAVEVGGKHHFGHPENFCIVGGRLRMHDYGSPGVRAVLVEYADRIYQNFDLDYSWEERKRWLDRGEC